MIGNQGVDPELLLAWLSARSIVRGLPSPILEKGGFRVDTNSDTELTRWVFPKMGAGLKSLARTISQPRYLLKLCGAADELQAVLPMGWFLHDPSYFMRASGNFAGVPVPTGYRMETRRIGKVLEAHIFSDRGALAASGYAVETQDAFIYDRIVTQPEHRRKGIGKAMMANLHSFKQNPNVPELLVATKEGRFLYATLGWQTVSPYSTASVGPC